jgi:polyhydroxyalkanoate synthesis regulator phasin
MKTKLLAAVVAAAVLIGGATAVMLSVGSGSASAASQTQTAASWPMAAGPMMGYGARFGATPPMLQAGGPLGQVLDQLVAKGTITKAQATAVTDALAASVSDHQPPAGFQPWFQNGTPPMLQAGSPLNQALDGLVAKGTISKTQATAITQALASWMQANCPRFGAGTQTS